MSDPIFNTLLYLYSSMIQADAALLGFGAIFIIFKIQSLYNRYEHTFALTQTWKSLQSVSKKFHLDWVASEIITNKTDTGRVALLLPIKYETLKIKYIESLITIPENIREIKKIIWSPVLTIGFHCVLSAICLWLTPQIGNICNTGLFNPINIVMVLIFMLGVYLSVKVAINLVIKDEELSLQKYFPEIHRQVYGDN
jgi:hypothetical protein